MSESNAFNYANDSLADAISSSVSALASSNSATNASNSASTASTQATNASNSASAAATSATNASNSASSASTSATNAANSATAAATSAASINLSSIAITGGSINGTTVGATTASTGNFTTLGATGVATFSAGTVSAPAITTTGDTNTGIFFPAADTIAFTEGGVESMRIDASGNLGIGTASPSQKFQVSGGYSLLNGLRISGADTSNTIYQATGALSITGDGASINIGANNVSGFVTLSTASAERMRIDSSGNVGIGTSSPTDRLHIVTNGTSVYNVFKASNANSTAVMVVGVGGSAVGATSLQNNAYLWNLGNSALSFGTNDTERMRIDSSGNVGIGQTPASTVVLDVKEPDAGQDAISRLTPGTGNSVQIRAIAQADSTTSAMSFYTVAGSASNERMRIDSNGNLLVGTTSSTTVNTGVVTIKDPGEIFIGHPTGTVSTWGYLGFRFDNTTIGSVTQSGTTAVLYNTTSDYRLKTDVLPITNALATVEALNPVSFTWIDGRTDEGFLAHEIQAVIPNCVTGEKDAVNEDGTPKYQQLDNSGVIPFLVKAIQEQQALIEKLTTRLNALEGK